jgi:hypothetical protein
MAVVRCPTGGEISLFATKMQAFLIHYIAQYVNLDKVTGQGLNDRGSIPQQWVRGVAPPRYPSHPVPGGTAGPPCLRGS